MILGVSVVPAVSIILGIPVVILVGEARVPVVAVMISVHGVTVQAVRVDQVTVAVGNLTALVEAGPIAVAMTVPSLVSVARGIGGGLQAVMEGGRCGVGRLHLVEGVGPLSLVEVADDVPGGGVGGLQLQRPGGDTVPSINTKSQDGQNKELHDLMNKSGSLRSSASTSRRRHCP